MVTTMKSIIFEAYITECTMAHLINFNEYNYKHMWMVVMGMHDTLRIQGKLN